MGSQMNERIRELVKQAQQYAEYVTPQGLEWFDTFKEKFAELIIKECMRMCDVAAVGYETHGRTKEANGCYSAKEYIEEHFGVES